jgi:DNA (cytosine-5)-methyltransferase 1
MPKYKPIPVVDLFAGPGGLGEGFSSLDNGNAFRIHVSAEMDEAAHKTLKLRAFYRLLKRRGEESVAPYYSFCNGESRDPWDEETADLWEEAGNEARRITLGTPEGNGELEAAISAGRLGPHSPWVLIGGPPCQAYSLVGRSRNRGKFQYRAEDDHRHFLYREYLKVIQKYRPAVFVMENVKGILSSKVGGQQIFHSILEDLADPDKALGEYSCSGYRIHSLSAPTIFESHISPAKIDAHKFIIRAEDYGIPQARHRVILLGVRADIFGSPRLLSKVASTTVLDALHGLPRLRSRISRGADVGQIWEKTVRQHVSELMKEVSSDQYLGALQEGFRLAESGISGALGCGSLRLPRGGSDFQPKSALESWYHDGNLRVWLNEETRSHMSTDLRRYIYAAVFAETFNRSPKGHQEFRLSGLSPAHKNWESGKFSDRFRVQQYDRPSTTITSHISKDGHYFIHPDPSQCRSLTVREAARLQTFPDNYFFQGNRTEQFHQVGNAVPPLLAQKIADLVNQLIRP